MHIQLRLIKRMKLMTDDFKEKPFSPYDHLTHEDAQRYLEILIRKRLWALTEDDPCSSPAPVHQQISEVCTSIMKLINFYEKAHPGDMKWRWFDETYGAPLYRNIPPPNPELYD